MGQPHPMLCARQALRSYGAGNALRGVRRARRHRRRLSRAFTQKSWRAQAAPLEDAQGRYACVTAGAGQNLFFRETDRALPPFDQHHIAIYINDFSGPHRRLAAKGLITQESDQHQYRFQDIVDPDSGKVLFTIEHEVRSMRHPLYLRPLVNRNPSQSIVGLLSRRRRAQLGDATELIASAPARRGCAPSKTVSDGSSSRPPNSTRALRL